jgi:hypothetical protein
LFLFFVSRLWDSECILASTTTFICLWDYKSIIDTVFGELSEGGMRLTLELFRN